MYGDFYSSAGSLHSEASLMVTNSVRARAGGSRKGRVIGQYEAVRVRVEAARAEAAELGRGGGAWAGAEDKAWLLRTAAATFWDPNIVALSPDAACEAELAH